MDGLNRYDRAAVALWARAHAELARDPRRCPLAQVAVHAVLAGPRRCQDTRALFASYEADAAADFALIGSLLPAGRGTELPWRVRDAAFHLRWRELTGEGS